MLTTTLIVLFLIFWTSLFFYFTRNFNHWKIKKVPYLPPKPFLGNAFPIFSFQENIGEFIRNIYKSTAKPFIGFFICDEPYLLIRDPKLVKRILVKDFSVFSNRNIFNNEKDDPIGSHLLFLLKTPDWRQMRKKITPVFTSGKMKNMFQLISEAADDMVKYLEEKSGENSVDVREVSARYSTDAITSTSFGINANCFKCDNSEFREVSRRVFNYKIFERAVSTTCHFIAPSLVKLFKMKFIDTASSDFLKSVFWKTMNEREGSGFVRNDLLDILIDMKKREKIDDQYKLEGDKLVAQAVQFFVAGFETTSSTIYFTLYELALNKTIQDNLRAEIRDAGEISYDSTKNMEYLDMCIKETLRMYPALPFLDRRCSTDYKIPDTDVILEKGSRIFISNWGLHYDPEYFPNPEKYDPMRFTEENTKARPSFTYLPFGEGPRNCIGARFGLVSSKIAVAKIISEFEVELCDQNQRSLKFDPRGFTLAPVSGLSLKFKKCGIV